jgi:hypothetical protein
VAELRRSVPGAVGRHPETIHLGQSDLSFGHPPSTFRGREIPSELNWSDVCGGDLEVARSRFFRTFGLDKPDSRTSASRVPSAVVELGIDR